MALLFTDPRAPDVHDGDRTVDGPLVGVRSERHRSGSAALFALMEEHPQPLPGPRKRRSGRGARGATARPQIHHTSHPTGRAAYAETRRWLLERHGPVCAYCGRTMPLDELTLDHVAPRRGQSAYDRRDNLVLACKRCNTAKADMPLLAFLLRNRTRATHLARYGDHLSTMLRDMVNQLAGVVADTADPDSPYRDVAYHEPAVPFRVVEALEALEAAAAAADEEEEDSPYAE